MRAEPPRASRAIARPDSAPWLRLTVAFVGATAVVYAALGMWWGSPTPAAHASTKATNARGAAGPNGHAVADRASVLRSQLRAELRRTIELRIGGATVTRTRESLGVRIDELRLSALVRSAAERPELALEGKLAPWLVDAKTAIAAFTDLKEDLDEPAQDARLDLEQRKVIPEKPGFRIDVYRAIAELEKAVLQGSPVVVVPTEQVAASISAADLSHAELDGTLGWFETRYATDRLHEDRTYNLRLAASRLNGHVILPGETFDFNAVVGPRDVAHGYRVAKVIADGELVDGIGGGTCQIAGTLHGAAVFAGLQIVQRTPHTRPSSYIKMGLDAAVAWPHVTLKIRNPFDHAVVLKETVVHGTVRAEVLGPKRSRVVTFVRRVEDLLPFSSREVRDDRLPRGERVTTQRGIPGFRIRRYRVVHDGLLAVREKSVDVYPPTLHIVHVGTGLAVGSAPPPTEDDHPEYVADEYLAITQGPGVGNGNESVPGMEEVRRAGRTGERGWSRRWSHASPRSHGGSDGEDSGEGDVPSREARSEPIPPRRKK